jgi:hypothetical protein
MAVSKYVTLMLKITATNTEHHWVTVVATTLINARNTIFTSYPNEKSGKTLPPTVQDQALGSRQKTYLKNQTLEPKIHIKSKAKVESPKHQSTKLISESTRPGSDRCIEATRHADHPDNNLNNNHGLLLLHTGKQTAKTRRTSGRQNQHP